MILDPLWTVLMARSGAAGAQSTAPHGVRYTSNSPTWPQHGPPRSRDVINHKELTGTRNYGQAASFRNPPPAAPGDAR
jgi:hypothetical protein